MLRKSRSSASTGPRSVEVANLDTRQLASADAEEEQAEERETIARVLGDREDVLKALDRHRVTYIVIGAFARVIQGSEELTRGIDVVPSTRPENLRRLEEALGDLNARREDGRELRFDEHSLEPMIPLRTDAGELKIVPEPEGTRATTSAAQRPASRSARACGRRSPRWVISRACSVRGAARSTSRTCGCFGA